jgi:hypothetical protein
MRIKPTTIRLRIRCLPNWSIDTVWLWRAFSKQSIRSKLMMGYFRGPLPYHKYVKIGP